MNMKHAPHKEIRDRNIKFQPAVTGVHGNPINGHVTSNNTNAYEQTGHRTGEGSLNKSKAV